MNQRTVKLDYVDDPRNPGDRLCVSTIHLPIDHSFGDDGATLTAITEQLRDRIASALSTYASNADLSVEAYTLILTNAGRMADVVLDAIAPAGTASSGLWLALPAEFTDEQWDRLAFGDYCGMFSGLTREQNAETWNASGSGDELGWINKSMFRKHAAGVIAELRELAAEPAVPE